MVELSLSCWGCSNSFFWLWSTTYVHEPMWDYIYGQVLLQETWSTEVISNSYTYIPSVCPCRTCVHMPNWASHTLRLQSQEPDNTTAPCSFRHCKKKIGLCEYYIVHSVQIIRICYDEILSTKNAEGMLVNRRYRLGSWDSMGEHERAFQREFQSTEFEVG